MAAATICDGARAMYDALPAEVRPSERRFLDARGIVGDPPHVQQNALQRYKAMDKMRAGFNKDWGYMGCVKAARAHANTRRAPQPRNAPTTPQQPRPAPRRAVITPPPLPYLAPAAASAADSAADSDEAWLAKTKGAATSHDISALEVLRDRQLVAAREAEDGAVDARLLRIFVGDERRQDARCERAREKISFRSNNFFRHFSHLCVHHTDAGGAHPHGEGALDQHLRQGARGIEPHRD